MNLPDWVPYVVWPALVIGYVTWYVWSRREHRAYVLRLAKERGWEYRTRDRSVGRYTERPFDKSNAKRRHILTGEYRGRQICVFELTYPEKTELSDRFRDANDGFLRNRVTCLVAAVTHDLPIPTMSVERIGLFTKINRFLGLPDKATGIEEFDNRFEIHTARDTDLSTVFDADLCRWMLDDKRARQLPLRIERGDVVTWELGKINAEKIDTYLDYLCDFLDHCPVRADGTVDHG